MFTITRLTPRVVSSAALTTAAKTSLASITHKPASRHATRTSFSTSAAMATKLSFEDAVQQRRSIYALQKKSPVSDERIKELVTNALKYTPSSFNSQSSRLVVLLKAEHDKFWDIVRDALKAIVPEGNWESTAKRLAGFKGGYGTILFYEDPEPIRAMQAAYAFAADKFPVWSDHTSAMHQYHLWTALNAEGFGVNLQHYNPLPDQQAAETWKIPLEWSLKAQMVFGEPVEGAREKLSEKEFKPIEDRLFFHGA